MTKRRGRQCLAGEPIAALALLLALAVPLSAAQEEPEVPVAPPATGAAPAEAEDEPLSPEERIARLPRELQQFLTEVELLISDEELDLFLSLEEDFRRHAFVEAFWRVRDPEPKTAYNELKRRWRARAEEALAAYGTTRDDRARMLLLNGEPTGIVLLDGRTYYRCWDKSEEIEIWFYQGSERTGNAFFALFYLPQLNSDGRYEIWLGDLQLRARRRFGLPSTNPADFCPEDLQAGVIRAISKDPLYIQEMTRLLEPPPPPSKEWVATFAARSAELPPGAQTFQASLEIDFPGRNQSRTAVRGLLSVPVEEATPAEQAGRTVYRFLLTGEVVRDARLLESFLYRFEVPQPPAAAGVVPLVFQRYLRPGAAELRLKIEDLQGDRFARFQRAVEVPSPTGLANLRRRPESGIFELYADAEEAAERGQQSIRILPPPRGQVHVGGMRFRTVGSGEFDKVTFYLDGEPVLTKRQPPFSVELNLGPVARTHRLRVVAFDAEGGEAASDEMVINRGGQRFRVRLSEPRPDKTYEGSLAAVAQLEVPEGKELERLEIFLDERLVATLFQPPWVQPVLLEQEGIAIVRAVAYLEDGHSTEDVVIVNAPDYFERVEINYVELYATVLDKSGRPRLGLEREDFRVLEDGVEQQIRRFERVSDLPIHAGLMIDTSASMEESLDSVRQAARVFAEEAVRPRDRLALFSFSLRPEVESPFTGEIDEVTGQLEGLRAAGTTALYDSLVFALHYFDGIRGQRALLLLSDGEDEASRFDFASALETARRAGVTIYVIGLEEASRQREARKVLRAFAEETGGRAFFLEGLDELPGVYRTIQEELRSKYLLTYQSTSEKAPSEFRRIEVEVAEKDAEVRTLAGYYP